MMHRLFVSMTVAGLLCGYMAMLYALMRIVVLIDHSYFLSLAMQMLDADVSKAILSFSVRVTSDSAAWLLQFWDQNPIDATRVETGVSQARLLLPDLFRRSEFDTHQQSFYRT